MDARRAKTRASFHLAVLLVTTIIAGCQSPGIKELSRPHADNPAAAVFFNPHRLSLRSRNLIREGNFQRLYRRNPLDIIQQLENQVAENPKPSRRLALAEICSDTAAKLETSDLESALACYLESAWLVYPEILEMRKSSGGESFQRAYNHACGKVATLLFSSGWTPSRALNGPAGKWTLSTRTSGKNYFDPSFADELKSVDYLQVRGFEVENTVEGIGGALIGYRRHTPERQESEPFLPTVGMAVSVTATLRFSHRRRTVELALHDVVTNGRMSLGGKYYSIAANFTASVAQAYNFKPKENVGWKGLIHPDSYASSTGLYQVAPFRSNRIPVVFVHGLMSAPITWVPALNQLQADPVIRENFQFLFFRYPTGFPIGYNAAALRQKLKEFQQHYDPDRSNPRMRRMILVGHSMGGIPSNLQIREGGEVVRQELFTKALEQIDLPRETKEALEKLINFGPNPNIERVIFVASPHRGSAFASKPIGHLGSNLVRYSHRMIFRPSVTRVAGLTEEGQSFLEDPKDSIYDLQPESHILHTILKLPRNLHTKLNSILGDSGKGGGHESSDGVVPYGSSHLEGVESEVFVPANHVQITKNPEAVEEIRNILLRHIGEN